MLDRRKGRYGSANGSARANRPWSLVEVLIRWLAEQANAEDEFLESPVWMNRAILEYETAGMPGEVARIYRAEKADGISSRTGNWRRAGYVPWEYWPMIQALTGLPTCVLDQAVRRKQAGSNEPIEVRIPGPGAGKAGRMRGTCVAA